MRRTSWPTEAGCQADQAADQARTDNGSQDTDRKARARATIAVRSPLRRVVFWFFQGWWGMAACAGVLRAARGGRLMAYRCTAQLVICTGSPSGVRRMKSPTALAST